MKSIKMKRDYVNKEVPAAAVPAWRRFKTAIHIIVEANTWEPVTVPENAAEVDIESNSSFTFGESSTAAGKETTQMCVGVLDMETIYLMGSVGQKIELVWGLL